MGAVYAGLGGTIKIKSCGASSKLYAGGMAESDWSAMTDGPATAAVDELKSILFYA